MARAKGEGGLFYSEARQLWIGRIALPPDPVTGLPRRTQTTAKTQAALQVKLSALRKQLERQGDLHTRAMKVDEFLDYWVREVVTPTRRPKATASIRSHLGHINGTIGRMRLPDVQPQHIRRVEAAMRSKGRSSTYIRNVHSTMDSAFRVAEQEGRIPRNPVELVNRPVKAVSPQEALTVREAIDMLEAFSLSAEGTLWATFILLGGRRGETLGLEWDRVGDELDLSWQLQRFTKGTVMPDGFEYRQLTDALYLTRPKTNAGWRVIPLVNPLHAILERYRETGPTNPYGLVFARPDGDPFDPDFITKQWPRIREAAGILRNVTVHGLRHTTADLLYAADISEVHIQAILGHSTRAMSRYYKSAADQKALRSAMLQLSASLSD